MSGVEGVVFDMGGILHPTPFELMGEVERERGLPPGTLPRGPFDPAGDDGYRAVERGELREGEYWRRVSARLAEAGIDFDCHSAIEWTARDRPEVVDAIRSMAPGYRLALLTNDATEWLGPGWWERWALRDCFEAVLDAAAQGVRKPEPEIYRRAAGALRLAPEVCLFVDDLQVNVEGARRVGMPALLFDVTDVRGSVARLLEAVGAVR